MILLLIALYSFSVLLLVPGALLAERSRAPDYIALLLPFFGLLVWTGLAMAGVGRQGLTHLVEAVAIAAFAVVLSYVKLFVAHRLNPRLGAVVFLCSTVVAAVAARLFTPFIPE